MWMYSWHELIALTAAGLALDWLIGDPKWPTHPVIYIGRWVRLVERKLRPGSAAAGIGGKAEGTAAGREDADAAITRAAGESGAAAEEKKKAAACGQGIAEQKQAAAGRDRGIAEQKQAAAGCDRGIAEQKQAAAACDRRGIAEQEQAAIGCDQGAAGRVIEPNASPKACEQESTRKVKALGVVLVATTLLLSFAVIYGLTALAAWVHPWLGYAVSVWFIASTVAVKGLKQAAYLVRNPLRSGDLAAARTYTGYIVGRDTAQLDEAELTRAVVETVAENIVDAVVSPLFYAVLGGAPLAMAYRAANTLDSMVGYRNAAYRDFGWASARLDDVLNWLPARLTGALLVGVALLTPGLSAQRAAQAIRRFARLHPSPNSGIPESAAAGALGIELGGLNVYGGVPSVRVRLGWPLRERTQRDIDLVVRMMYGVSLIAMGGLLCALLWL